MRQTYVFDTSAILETLKRSPSYEKYRAFHIITTKLNLFEVSYCMLTDYDTNLSELFLQNYYPLAKNLSLKTIQKAVQLKQMYRKFSITQCIGYALAMQLKIPFLTSDKAFQSLPSVEYVPIRDTGINS